MRSNIKHRNLRSADPFLFPPPPLAWTEVSVSLLDYRYLRYRGPSGSYGNVAEIEFYHYGVKLTGTGLGTPGSWSDGGNAPLKRRLMGM